MATASGSSSSRRSTRSTSKPASRKTEKEVKTYMFVWQGVDKHGRSCQGELRAASEAVVRSTMQRQGIRVLKLKKRRVKAGKTIKPKDIALFTRQLSTMIKAGVPLLQSFDIVARGSENPKMTKLLLAIKGDIETGTSLNQAFRKYPMHFDALYCNLIEAGEQAGILENLLDRLATYMEKTENIKRKIKSALMYPIAVIVVAFVVVTIIMIFVIPSFEQVFSSFGADLPAPTMFVIGMSKLFVKYWYIVLLVPPAAVYFFLQAWKRNEKVQQFMDRLLLKIPIFGPLVEKSVIARWTRTMSTMFAAGVPLVESLDSVAGAAGNSVYAQATKRIQQDVAQGTSLSTAMTTQRLFPVMVLQMTTIGEESGSVDHMLGKAADFYEAEVDDMVAGISSLMEPIIIVVLGVVIGGIVVSMYLPIFKLGQVV